MKMASQLLSTVLQSDFTVKVGVLVATIRWTIPDFKNWIESSVLGMDNEDILSPPIKFKSYPARSFLLKVSLAREFRFKIVFSLQNCEAFQAVEIVKIKSSMSLVHDALEIQNSESGFSVEPQCFITFGSVSAQSYHKQVCAKFFIVSLVTQLYR